MINHDINKRNSTLKQCPDVQIIEIDIWKSKMIIFKIISNYLNKFVLKCKICVELSSQVKKISRQYFHVYLKLFVPIHSSDEKVFFGCIDSLFEIFEIIRSFRKIHQFNKIYDLKFFIELRGFQEIHCLFSVIILLQSLSWNSFA